MRGMSEPTTVPTVLRAGDSARWLVATPGYLPADGWALHYRLLWPAGAAVSIDTDAEGDTFVANVPATTSASFTPGTATLAWWVTRGDERKTLGHRPITILPDLSAIATFDGRSFNEKALADARAALAAYLASGRGHVESYAIAGRQMKFRTADELRALIEHFERECATERARALSLQGHAAGRLLTRF